MHLLCIPILFALHFKLVYFHTPNHMKTQEETIRWPNYFKIGGELTELLSSPFSAFGWYMKYKCFRFCVCLFPHMYTEDIQRQKLCFAHIAINYCNSTHGTNEFSIEQATKIIYWKRISTVNQSVEKMLFQSTSCSPWNLWCLSNSYLVIIWDLLPSWLQQTQNANNLDLMSTNYTHI